jgi:O-antigen ligase
MISAFNSNYPILNRIALAFLLLFAATLTNSIFLNQLGYYIALVFLGVAYFKGDKETFKKNGLEIFILLFFLAELFSFLFSANKPVALENFFKRMILIPIIYTIPAGINDTKQFKTFFFTFLVFSLFSDVLYNIASVDHYLKGLYSTTDSGPSIIVHPITASQLSSISALLLFSLFLKEKSFKLKAGYFGLFLISFIALIATNKRTGWIGFALGIGAIFILNKNYLIVATGVVALLILLFNAENISKVSIYSHNGKLINEFSTEGSANDILLDSGHIIVSDFNNGIVTFDAKKMMGIYKAPDAVSKLQRWDNDHFVAFCDNSRLLLLNKTANGSYILKKEFLTPGQLEDIVVFNGRLYAADYDSGLTIFNSVKEIDKPLRYSKLRLRGMTFDSTFLCAYLIDSGNLIWNLKDGIPQDSIIFNQKLPTNSVFIGISEKKVYYYGDQKFLSVDPNSKKIKLLKGKKFEVDVSHSTKNGNDFYIYGSDKSIYKLNLLSNDSVSLQKIMTTSFYPKAFKVDSTAIYLSNVKRDRLLSFFDMQYGPNRNRIVMWRVGWEIFLDHPFFGVGDIGLEYIFLDYRNPWEKEVPGHLHNTFFQIIAILGGFGLLAVSLIFIIIVTYQIKIYRRISGDVFLSGIILGCFGGVISFLGAGLTEWNFGDHEIISMVWFITGLSFAVGKVYDKIKND